MVDGRALRRHRDGCIWPSSSPRTASSAPTLPRFATPSTPTRPAPRRCVRRSPGRPFAISTTSSSSPEPGRTSARGGSSDSSEPACVAQARMDMTDAEIRAALDRHWAASNAGSLDPPEEPVPSCFALPAACMNDPSCACLAEAGVCQGGTVLRGATSSTRCGGGAGGQRLNTESLNVRSQMSAGNWTGARARAALERTGGLTLCSCRSGMLCELSVVAAADASRGRGG